MCPCRHYDDKEMEAAQGYWNCPCVPMRERKVGWRSTSASRPARQSLTPTPPPPIGNLAAGVPLHAVPRARKRLCRRGHGAHDFQGEAQRFYGATGMGLAAAGRGGVCMPTVVISSHERGSWEELGGRGEAGAHAPRHPKVGPWQPHTRYLPAASSPLLIPAPACPVTRSISPWRRSRQESRPSSKPDPYSQSSTAARNGSLLLTRTNQTTSAGPHTSRLGSPPLHSSSPAVLGDRVRGGGAPQLSPTFRKGDGVSKQQTTIEHVHHPSW